jgi:hypothetical protein
MNAAPVLSTNLAVFLTLFAAFLWGTWFISVKHLGDYPMDAFYITLFATALVFVWAIGLIVDGPGLISNMTDLIQIAPVKMWVTFACGVLYVLGMRLTLHVFATIGFSLSQPILSSVNVLIGTLASALLGGIPAGFVPGLMLMACLLLLAAIITSFFAGRLRSAAQEKDQLRSALLFTMGDMWRALGLLTLASLLMPAYTMGLSFGLKSITQPVGLAVLPFMALLSAGAFSGALLGSGIILTKRRQWHTLLKTPLSILKFGVVSGIFHFGGNIIHTFATASLSSVISWPLGVTYTLWTLLWGMLYGEFRGAPRRSFALLALAVLLYLAGAYLVSIQA